MCTVCVCRLITHLWLFPCPAGTHLRRSSSYLLPVNQRRGCRALVYKVPQSSSSRLDFSHHAEQYIFKGSQICSSDDVVKHNSPSHHPPDNFTPVWVLFHCSRHTLNLVMILHMSLACTYNALWVNWVSHFAMFGLATRKWGGLS